MKIKKLLILTCTLLTTKTFAHVSERKLYVGSNSTEAIVEFDGRVTYKTTAVNPALKSLKNVIESQLEYIVGPISMTEYTAVPKGDHSISNIKIVNRAGDLAEVSYHYKGTMVVENGPTSSYEILLPINPKTIFQAAMVGSKNPCTDDHYQTEGDFWYFWSPDRSGCKLKAGKDYLKINAKLSRIQNSKLTYPEYQNLPNEKGVIEIHALFGMDEADKDRNPLKSSDINAYNYREIRETLIKKGYLPKTWTESEVKKIAKTLDGAAPFVETLTKGKISFRLMFAPTGIDEEAKGFHWFYKDAIENASIMIYSGHSGLGGHLDLDSIESDLGQKINFNTKRYQIFFFDSCTSYRYYNSQYLERKMTESDPNGTKKLDIFVNGLSTLFSSMPTSLNTMATAVEKSVDIASQGKGFVSYQTIAKQIDSDNLFGIVGDEDNAAPNKK
jgi:hypothetical protein